jgi:hypothetical protein
MKQMNVDVTLLTETKFHNDMFTKSTNGYLVVGTITPTGRKGGLERLGAGKHHDVWLQRHPHYLSMRTAEMVYNCIYIPPSVQTILKQTNWDPTWFHWIGLVSP